MHAQGKAAVETLVMAERAPYDTIAVHPLTPVIVRDASGEMVFDLKEPNFKVYDNGTEQKIDHFDVAVVGNKNILWTHVPVNKV